MAADGMSDINFITDFITHTLTPDLVYENFTAIAGIAALAPWLYVIFLAVRIFQESSAAMSGKAAVAQALTDSSKTMLIYLGYTSGGLVVFGLLLSIGQLFDSNVGSAQMIHSNLLELREVMMSDGEAQKSFFQQVLEGVLDGANLFSAALAWGIYQFLSTAYVFLLSLINVTFAIGVALTYAWGFIAILTMNMKGEYNLMPGFSKTILTFGIWLILDPILMFFLWLMSSGAVDYLAGSYAGFGSGTTAVMIWYVFACLMMIMVLLLKITAPFLATYLASNQSMVGALGAAPAVLGGMVANQVIKQLADNQIGKEMGAMMPSNDGVRSRDGMAQGLNDTLRTPMGQLAKSLAGMGSGAGSPSAGNDLTSSGGGQTSGPTGSPAIDGGSSASSPQGGTSSVHDAVSRGVNAAQQSMQAGSGSGSASGDTFDLSQGPDDPGADGHTTSSSPAGDVSDANDLTSFGGPDDTGGRS